jgi:CDP-diacylglycerol--glycerol-3-phosphate 3-phosphatidyltransferase
MSDEARGVALVVAAVTSLQFGAAFAVTLFDDLGPAGAAFLRLALAAAVLLAIWRPRVRGHSIADLRVAVLFGIALGLMNWAIYSAMDRIPLGVAVTIEFAGPLGVAVVASRRPLDLLWVVLAAAGIVLLADPGGGSLDAAGVGFALLAAGMWAAYILLSVRTGRLFPGGSGLAIAMAVGAVVVLPMGVAQAGGALLEPGLLAAGAAVALASSVIPYSFELEALRRADVSRARGRGAGGPRSARPGPRAARVGRDRAGRRRQCGRDRTELASQALFELTVPNVLTVFRILLVPVLVTALLSGASSDALAAGVFVLASFTDVLDGWLARRHKSESNFGKLMDPLADKLLVTSALVSLVSLDRLQAWVAMVIIAREFAVTGLRQLAIEQGHVIAANVWGKVKTILQIGMVLALIAVDDSPAWVDALVYVTVAVTIYSGVNIFFNFRAMLSARPRSAREASRR